MMYPTVYRKFSWEGLATVNVLSVLRDTGYSSTEDQTDDSPFITASGAHVEDGIVAINGLPFGTKVRIPDLYGDKVFTVEDRMHERMGNAHADIWFADRHEAVEFGARFAKIEILES